MLSGGTVITFRMLIFRLVAPEHKIKMCWFGFFFMKVLRQNHLKFLGDIVHYNFKEIFLGPFTYIAESDNVKV